MAQAQGHHQGLLTHWQCSFRSACGIVLTTVCLMGILTSYRYSTANTFPGSQRKPSDLSPTSRSVIRPTTGDSVGDDFELLQWNFSQRFQQAFKKINSGQTDEPDERFMEKQALVQLRRKKVLRGACRRHPLLHQDPRSAGQMFILEKRKILYCSVPKTGSTNWKRIFMVLEGVRPNLQNISSYEAHYSNGFKVLPHSGLLRQIRELDSYTKFLQVRHPFARLISAYRNKISGEIPWNWQEERFQQIALYIARKYRKGAHAGLFNLTTLRVSWDEWVRYLTDPAERSGFNSHWREMYKLCLPCRVQYDLIGKLESVDSDLSFLLDHLGLQHILFPSIRPLYHREDEKTGNALIRQYFGNMSQRDLQRLYKIYQLDFEIFGFEKPGLLNF